MHAHDNACIRAHHSVPENTRHRLTPQLTAIASVTSSSSARAIKERASYPLASTKVYKAPLQMRGVTARVGKYPSASTPGACPRTDRLDRRPAAGALCSRSRGA